MYRVQVKELTDLSNAILVAAGATQRSAQCVARSLVTANLAGVDSHGVRYLAHYVSAIRNGYLMPHAVPSVVTDSQTSCLVSGNWTFGQVAGHFALDRVIAKAQQQGLAICGLVEAHHLGRLGEYAERAAAEGIISLMFASGYSHDLPVAAPYGGRSAALHTNPLAIGIPITGSEPLVLDYATTATTSFKVTDTARRGEMLPPGLIVNSDGDPTTDPSDLDSGGAHLAFGGHKGYALMVMVEMLGYALTGANRFARDDHVGSTFRHQGCTIIALRADLFQPAADFAATTSAVVERIHEVLPMDGVTQVMVPGEPESLTRRRRVDAGIPLIDDEWLAIESLAADLGVSSPDVRKTHVASSSP